MWESERLRVRVREKECETVSKSERERVCVCLRVRVHVLKRVFSSSSYAEAAPTPDGWAITVSAWDLFLHLGSLRAVLSHPLADRFNQSDQIVFFKVIFSSLDLHTWSDLDTGVQVQVEVKFMSAYVGSS